MRNTDLFVLMVAIGSPWLISSYATTSPKSAAAETGRIMITTGVLDDGDLRTYRTLLTLSDDLGNGGPEIVPLAQTK